MPLKRCSVDGKKGWKYGASGKCYTYSDKASEKRAKKSAIKQAIAIGGGKPPADFDEDDRAILGSMPELETVDLEAVEIMAADIPVHGRGSAPEGDVYSQAALAELATATNEVIDELRPFVKISHSEAQALAKASGLYEDDGTPATGWMTNFRAEGDKLLTDLKRVPKKLAELVEVGAFRLRSPEVRPYKSQSSDKSYPLVVQALAFEGAKPVAFKTLDDIYALYHEGERPRQPLAIAYAEELGVDPAEVVKHVDYAAGDVIWDPESGAQDLMQDLTGELNGPTPPGAMQSYRFWVQDIDTEKKLALVCDSSGEESTYWLVPYTIGDDGDPVPAPSDQWTQAQQAWIEASSDAASAYAEGLATVSSGEGDTRPRMPRKPDESGAPIELNAKTFAEIEGLELAEDASPEDILAKVRELVAAKKEPPKEGGEPATPPEGVRQMSEDEYSSLLEMAKAGVRAEKTLYEERRDHAIETAIKEKRIPPADRDKWVTRYDEAPTIAAELLAELPPSKDGEVYGTDFSEGDPEKVAEAMGDEREYAEFCALTGIDYVPNRVLVEAVQRGTNGSGT